MDGSNDCHQYTTCNNTNVNITVLPSLDFIPFDPITVICEASPPGISGTVPAKIEIFIGEYPVEECLETSRCVYNLETYFPILSRNISCNITDADGGCRFKVSNLEEGKLMRS